MKTLLTLSLMLMSASAFAKTEMLWDKNSCQYTAAKGASDYMAEEIGKNCQVLTAKALQADVIYDIKLMCIGTETYTVRVSVRRFQDNCYLANLSNYPRIVID